VKDDFFNYLVATDEIDDFLGEKEKDMGLFDDEKPELEEEMDNLGLEDWQKELVREGKYDPENFEEDDLEDEDDYYYEDDE